MGSAGIAQILDLALAIPAAEAVGAESLVSGQDGQVLDLVVAVVAAVGAVVAYQRAVTKEEEVRVRVEQGAAGVAAEAVDVPSVAGCGDVSGGCRAEWKARARRRVPVAGCSAYLVRMPCLPRESAWAISVVFRRAINLGVYLSAPLARIHDIVLVQRRLWISAWRLHRALGCSGALWYASAANRRGADGGGCYGPVPAAAVAAAAVVGVARWGGFFLETALSACLWRSVARREGGRWWVGKACRLSPAVDVCAETEGRASSGCVQRLSRKVEAADNSSRQQSAAVTLALALTLADWQ